MKTCIGCKETKPLTEFYGKLDRFQSRCKPCCKIYNRQKYLKSRPAALEAAKLWYSQNRQKAISCVRERNKTPKYVAYRKTYFSLPSTKAKARVLKAKWRQIPQNKISNALRGRISKALKGVAKSKRTEKLLGISFEDFQSYLETLFLPGMSWDNYGHKGWHVDHIIPCSYFDFTQPRHQLLCFCYLNLRPMWAKDNHSKNDTLPPNHAEILLLLENAVSPLVVAQAA